MDRDYCYITKCKDGVYIESLYDPDFVDALKRHIPVGERRWDSELKRWWVSAKYAAQAKIDAGSFFNNVIEV